MTDGRDTAGRTWGGGHRLALGLLLAVVAVWGGVLFVALRDAAEAAAASQTVTAVFAPGAGIKDAFMATAAAGGSIVSDTWLPNVWILHSEQTGYAMRLREAGALVVLDLSPFSSLTAPTCGGV